MDGQHIKIYHWLYPLSWLYGLGVQLRNKLFDWGWLRSKSFDIPVICIGNLAVGGTGKTPHTEYLIQLLRDQHLNVATLSRGYKRKTKGYILADEQSSAQAIGDEPCQMKSKFPDIRVAVDENRCHGIEELMKLTRPPVDVVLLDDAFQHRRVQAKLNILLTDYHRLLCDDTLLPAGRLREPAENKQRAQIVIVTKCPAELKPIDFNIIGKQLHLYPYQRLFFSGLCYGKLQPVFPECAPEQTDISIASKHILLITGIASPATMKSELEQQAAQVDHLAFNDHHDYSRKDFLQIKEHFDRLKGEQRFLVTTEKDAVRLKGHPFLPKELKPYLYTLPVAIKILQNQEHTFNQTILSYVRKNSRNSSLS